MAAAKAVVAAEELDLPRFTPAAAAMESGENQVTLRFEARDEVTTVPGLARVGGEPSICWKLLRGVEIVIDSASALPRLPEKGLILI